MTWVNPRPDRFTAFLTITTMKHGTHTQKVELSRKQLAKGYTITVANPTDRVIAAIRREPGLKLARLRELTGLPQRVIDEVCDMLITSGQMTMNMRLRRKVRRP